MLKGIWDDDLKMQKKEFLFRVIKQLEKTVVVAVDVDVVVVVMDNFYWLFNLNLFYLL